MTAYDCFRYWDTDLRPPLVAALQACTDRQLRWKAAGYHSSILDLATHTCGTEWIWIHRNLLRREEWSQRWEPGFTGLEPLLGYWERLHTATTCWLRSLLLEELARPYPLPYDDLPEATLHWVVYHVMEHEAHHRGQVFALMRMQGLIPPET